MHEIHQTCARIEKKLDVLILAVFTYHLASVAMLVKLTFCP